MTGQRPCCTRSRRVLQAFMQLAAPNSGGVGMEERDDRGADAKVGQRARWPVRPSQARSRRQACKVRSIGIPGCAVQVQRRHLAEGRAVVQAALRWAGLWRQTKARDSSAFAGAPGAKTFSDSLDAIVPQATWCSVIGPRYRMGAVPQYRNARERAAPHRVQAHAAQPSAAARVQQHGVGEPLFAEVAACSNAAVLRHQAAEQALEPEKKERASPL